MSNPDAGGADSHRPRPWFQLVDVVVRFGDKTVLDHVDLVLDGSRTAIVGPSGSGKSTLLRLLNRLEVPTSGDVRLDGCDLASLDPLALRRGVAMVFQRPVVFPGAVFDNLALAEPGISRADAVAALEEVGLAADLLDQEAATLSGGEAQRLALARALRTRPRVVLADEVTSSLDRASEAVIEQLLSKLAAEGLMVIAVTHDPAQAVRLAERIVVVAEGRIRGAGTAAELERSPDPLVRRAVGAPS